MKIVDDSPPVLGASIGRIHISPVGTAPNLRRLTQGRGQYVSDVVAAHGASGLCPLAARSCPHRQDRDRCRKEIAWRHCGCHRSRACEVMTPWVGVLTHLKG